MQTHLVVNGDEREVSLDGDRSLLSVLREELGLTGTKFGCGEGECGACTVLVGRRAVRSCIVALSEVANQQVTTVEGLAEDGLLHPVQHAFVEQQALQCGYCTPGWIMSTAALLARTPEPSENQIRAGLESNLCRCGAYPRILRAVRRAAELLRDPELVEDRTAPAIALADPSAGVAFPWDLQEPGAPDFFLALGDGLVAVLPPDVYPLGHGVAAGPAPANGGAWVHVAGDGSITAFSGKVEVGQGTRTAFALLVAEELRSPVEAVRVVMGDTAVVPFDAGTFGSRSMPDAGEFLRTTAAAAREALVRLAADRLGVDGGKLAVEHGAVVGPGGDPVIGWPELLAGLRHVEKAAGDAPVTPPATWSTAGRATPSATGIDAVTGRKRFPYDLVRPDMLHGRVLRPPSFGARLLEVELPPADALGDALIVRDGDFIGAVAPSPAAAAAALAGVRSRWQAVPQPTDTELVEHLRSHQSRGAGRNVPFHHEAGDVEGALARATTRFAASYTTAYIAHTPLEPRSALAEWEGDHLTVWLGTQRPFDVRHLLAERFELAEGQVRVVVPDFGGGFGGKHTPEVALEAARLARGAGRPVKVQWSRAEEFTWAYFRPAAVIDVESGTDAEGRITAWSFTNLNSGPAAITTPYEIEHQGIEYRPADSPLAIGSYRALAATANTFARESHMDEMAHRLGIDPLEFRLRHLGDERLAEVLRAAAERIGWGSGGRRPGTGVGIAGCTEKGGRVATCAEVRVDDRDRLEVLRVVTAFECGAIVNPDNLANQVEGATVMGLGGALFEQIRFADGRIENAALADYRVPRLTDLPAIEVILIDRRDQPSAGGGETPIIAVAPAIGNAVFAATGVRVRQLPIAPDGVIARGA
ncbi:MAG TPA: molybdopterin cofactor-binding domain-containing protein [Acidimicrobiales bacterium]|nr:molybdopterin cofactor-binding domain-containing protein [Acidimicrobiales bacterium]